MRVKSITKKLIMFGMALSTLIIVNNVEAFAGDRVDMVFTTDLHSYIREYDEIVDGQQQTVGGFSRIKTYIDERVNEHPDTLILDGGDIVMGTLPQALANTEACELKFLSDFGYDALTYGNHEFDYGAKALADMYSITARDKEKRPQFVICNVDWDQTDEYTETLKKGMSEYGYTDYFMLERNGVKIAITGVIGVDAIKCSPTCELTFFDPIESVKKTVEKIKANENPDMIICISHSGTGGEAGYSEDEKLAEEVPDLDVILSGHSHVALFGEILVGNTHVVSNGCYGLYVGTAAFTRNEFGRWDTVEYNLKLMDESVAKDAGVETRLDEIDEIINETVLKDYGLTAQQVIARNDNIAFESVNDMYQLHDETMLGNLLSDAYRYAADLTPEGKAAPFAMAVAPSGTIRGTFPIGDITVSKAFEALSLGIGPDGKVGYPLVSLYLTGKEIKTAAEIDASVSDLMKSARLYMSGISFEFNPKRLILDKTIDVWSSPAFLEQSRSELEDDKLYHVVTDSYSMNMLGAVTDMSKGLLSLVPKDANGNPLTDPMECIIYDENGEELKAWKSLCDYMMTFEKDANGVSVIPAYYSAKQNRRVVNASLSPRAMFKNTSKFFYIIVAVLLLIILLIIVIIKTCVKAIHKRKIYK